MQEFFAFSDGHGFFLLSLHIQKYYCRISPSVRVIRNLARCSIGLPVRLGVVVYAGIIAGCFPAGEKLLVFTYFWSYILYHVFSTALSLQLDLQGAPLVEVSQLAEGPWEDISPQGDSPHHRHSILSCSSATVPPVVCNGLEKECRNRISA